MWNLPPMGIFIVRRVIKVCESLGFGGILVIVMFP